MKYLSVCSGIEAATVAWHDMGWKPVAFSEIEKFPSQVLQHHYPTVPNVGDMTKYKEWNLDPIGLLVGGTPCQSFSVAGLRKGLDDPRGNLALVYCGILDHFRPRWFVWENVPGVLSSNGGRDFGSFLGALAQLGYGFAYRVLDAQWFGVAQRRRRVFVVGYLGDWHRAAAVLFERHSLSGHPAPSRKAKQDSASSTSQSPYGDGIPTVAQTLSSRDHKGPSCGRDGVIGNPIPVTVQHDSSVFEYHPNDSRVKEMGEVCQTMTSRWGTGGGNIPIAIHATQDPISGFISPTLGSNMYAGVAVDVYNQAIDGQTAATLTRACGGTNTSGPKVMQSMAVRRLTPLECERLQGFPDGYTDIRPKGKNTPDGPRYKALGNSMAVPVMKWIGKRIQMVEEL